jgi:hypothetical protein
VAAGILFVLIQGVATFLKDILVLRNGGNEPW